MFLNRERKEFGKKNTLNNKNNALYPFQNHIKTLYQLITAA